MPCSLDPLISSLRSSKGYVLPKPWAHHSYLFLSEVKIFGLWVLDYVVHLIDLGRTLSLLSICTLEL